MGFLDAVAGLFGGGVPAAPPAMSDWSFSVPSDGGGFATPPMAPQTDVPSFQDPAAAGAGGGSNLWSLLPAVTSGAGGLMGLFQGGATDKAIKAMQSATGPLQKAGEQQLKSFTSGQLSPPMQAALDQKRRELQAQAEQYLAQAGISDSTTRLQMQQNIDQQLLAFQNQLMQTEWSNAAQSAGLATTNLTNIARMQAQQDEQQRQAWAAFMQALGQLGSDIGGGPVTY